MGSEGVYRIAGVPLGEILFHIAAQPECLVCLRSRGLAVPPHKAIFVQKGRTKGRGKAKRQDADRLKSAHPSCGTDTTAVSKTL